MSELPELLALKFENLTLKLGALETQMDEIRRVGSDLVAQRTALLDEMRLAADAPAGAVYDPQTRTFKVSQLKSA